MVVGTAHVHCDTLESFSFPGELSQEGEDFFSTLPLHGMKDSSCSKILDHCHVLPLPDAELVNSDVADLVEGDFR